MILLMYCNITNFCFLYISFMFINIIYILITFKWRNNSNKIFIFSINVIKLKRKKFEKYLKKKLNKNVIEKTYYNFPSLIIIYK